MKKILIFAALVVIGIIIYRGCGKEKITVTGQNGTEYESYQECCIAQDFEAAHLFLAKMKNSGDWDKEYSGAKEYVYKNEALFLMSQNDETAQKRIIYLLKEDGDDNALLAKLIDIAIDDDNETFVKKLAELYTGGANQESLKKVMNYLLEKPQEENKEFIKKLFEKIGAKDLLLKMAIKNGDSQYIIEYASEHLSLSNTLLLNYLAETKDKKNSEMILVALAEEEKKIPTRPALGTINVRDYWTSGKEMLIDDYVDYRNRVSDFNNQCNTLLGIAIKYKNIYLAQRIVSKAKSNISYRNIGENGNNDYAWKVTIDYEEANSIKKAYQDAVHNGAFR